MDIFKSLERKLDAFIMQSKRFIPNDLVAHQLSNSNDQVIYYTRKLIGEADESTLLEEYVKIVNIYVESSFWFCHSRL